MLDTPKSHWAEDFRTRYRNTYGFLIKENKEKLLVFIKSVDRQVIFTTEDQTEYFAYFDKDVMFEFLPITRGWYQTRQGPMLLQRIPAKQYNRGISKANTSLTTVNAFGDLQPISGTHALFADVFVHKPVASYADFVSKKNPYWIVNKFFLISKDNVFVYDLHIGKYVNNKIILSNGLYKQELQDAMNRGKFPIAVVDNV